MRKNKLITILFLSGLSLITLASFAKTDDVFSQKEKRYLAQKPKLSFETLFSGEYGKNYETYLNDQFPLREPLAALHTDVEGLLGKSEISGIYFGKSDYFIEHHEEKEYETDLAKRNKTAVLDFLKKMSEQLGSDRVRFLPAPSAETVLTNYLPEGAPPSAETSILKEYQNQLNTIGMEELLVSAKDALIHAGKSEKTQLYYRTDHHWTTDGAFISYNAWAKSLGITPRKKTEFSEVNLKEDFYGTISARVNTKIRPDTLKALMPDFDVNYQIEYSSESGSSDSLYALEMLDSPEPYAVYLKGNQPLTRIITNGVPAEMSDRKLLVVKDSFGNSLIPFLVNHYPETLVVDLRYYSPSLRELIETEQITDICVVGNPAQMAKEKSFYKINR